MNSWNLPPSPSSSRVKLPSFPWQPGQQKANFSTRVLSSSESLRIVEIVLSIKDREISFERPPRCISPVYSWIQCKYRGIKAFTVACYRVQFEFSISLSLSLFLVVKHKKPSVAKCRGSAIEGKSWRRYYSVRDPPSSVADEYPRRKLLPCIKDVI